MLDLPSPLTSQEVPIDFVPSNEQELLQACSSWRWRIMSGRLYKIMVKGDEDSASGDGTKATVLPFHPNQAQVNLLRDLHTRTVILKARQLGFTTLIQIVWLDHALWVPDQRCGVIAHSKDDVQTIFRDKIQFAYENMPDILKLAFPLAAANKTEYLFAHNNSSIRVAMSMRSGTIHRLHVSEMGKLANKYPAKAEEVVTGALPAVPQTGIAVIESTAEGRAGEFYEIATRAEHLAEQVKAGTRQLGPRDWAFKFYPWWGEPKYQVDPRYVIISPDDHAYFDAIEFEMDTLLTNRQRAWYVAQRESEFSGDHAKMWREFPSTPKECWQQSTAGKYYPNQLSAARIQGRIHKSLPYIPEVPVHSFWDIGAGDGTGIWLMQIIGGNHNFLRYIEGWVESYAHYVSEMDQLGMMWGKHFVPHDADHQRQQEHTVASPVDMLQSLRPGWDFVTVPRVQRVQHRIDLVRQNFHLAHFDEEGCKEGLAHLGNYQKSWSTILSDWTDTPLKNKATEAADSFGQWAQAIEGGAFGETRKRTPKSRRGGMAV